MKSGRECKASTEYFTPYQFKDRSHTIPTHYYYYYLKRLAMQGREREIETLSVRRKLPTYRGKEEKGKIVENKKGESN